MSSLPASLLSRISRKQRKTKEPIASVHKVPSSNSEPASSFSVEEASSDSEDFTFVNINQCMDVDQRPEVDRTQLSTSESNIETPHEPMAMSASVDPAPSRVAMPMESQGATSAAVEEEDFANISIRVLRFRTRKILSMHLNPLNEISINDWRGLADYLGFSQLEIRNFALPPDPTAAVLQEWETKADSTIGKLKEALQYLERDDVLDELEKPIKIDVKHWNKNKHDETQPLQVAEVSGSYPNAPMCPELRGITLEDHPDGPVQTFDAFICHNTQTDFQFVQEIIEKMESSPYNLKLCTEWRDLVPGGDYNTVTAELIENRCKRMIVVLSPEFLQDEKSDFHIKFALSLSPGARSRRMVLVMLKPCEPPSILRFITVCDYTREALRPFFWPRLYAALNLS